MSTREYAVKIFNGLTDLQLEKFVSIFAGDSNFSDKEEDVIREKKEVFADINKIVKRYPSSDSGFEEIKDEYFKEKYGL